jgi:hypothetical protein
MTRIYTAPALLNRSKPGSFKWYPEKMNAWDDRIAHLKEVEEKKGGAGLREVRKQVGEQLYHGTLNYKKQEYS